MKKIVSLISLLIITVSCKNTQIASFEKKLNTGIHKNNFTGILVINPTTKDTIYSYNSKKYFTPASNTKIFTLYTALSIIPDSIPSLKYISKNDSVYIQGTGDPTLLHPYFKDSSTINFLKQKKNIVLNTSNFNDSKYGPGWAWEDYAIYFSPERGGFPMYGNTLTIHKKDSLNCMPEYFKDSIISFNFRYGREEHSNTFYTPSKIEDTITIPFITSKNLSKNLLEDILKKQITWSSSFPEGKKNILYSITTDSVYKRMMHESDNFLAEQLMFLSSNVLTDTTNFKNAKKYILNTNLATLKQKPRWVDGSGLSRYNLFTPESMVHVLNKLYKKVSTKRLYTIFPEVNSPIKTLENVPKTPYLYAKSGSLGNNYCLSGYLVTNSGKTLIFSYMNNHFVTPSKDIKKEMHYFLEYLRDNY